MFYITTRQGNRFITSFLNSPDDVADVFKKILDDNSSAVVGIAVGKKRDVVAIRNNHVECYQIDTSYTIDEAEYAIKLVSAIKKVVNF